MSNIMSVYTSALQVVQKLKAKHGDSWSAISPEHAVALPNCHTTALSMNDLSEGYFGKQGMLAYVQGVQRQEIRKGVACVKHQAMSGSDIGDDHKEFFAGEQALKAGGEKNTSNQFNNI